MKRGMMDASLGAERLDWRIVVYCGEHGFD